MPLMLDRSVLRWGGLAAVVGAVLGMIGNLLHPRGDAFTAAAELELVRGSDIWLFDHFLIAWSFAFVLVGLVAIGWSFAEPVAQSWGRIATASAIGGITIAYITIGIDGMALDAVADAGGPAGEAVAHVSLALFTGTIGSLFGVTPVLFGIAGLSSGEHPKGLAYLALAGGFVGLLVASIQFLSGPSTLTTMLFLVSSVAYTIWLGVMGWRLWKAPVGATAATVGTGARV